MTQNHNNQVPAWLFPIVQSIVILLVAVVVAYKVLTTPFNLTVDFPSLLSLLLALFSVGLAALFYFKATETSNAFYDNTYKFTRDVAELLVRIESGFGERLRHLDESYAGIQTRFLPPVTKEDSEKAQQHVKKEEENLAAKLQERETLISELTARAQLDGVAKKDVIQRLNEQEEALAKAKFELAKARHEAKQLRARSQQAHGPEPLQREIGDDEAWLIDSLGGSTSVKNASHQELARRWSKAIHELPSEIPQSLAIMRYLNPDMTLNSRGLKYVKSLAYAIH